MLTIGSLFSGIGGLELGLERATGAEVVWQVEWNPFCRRVLEKHWPQATRHDDVRTVRSLPYVDIMCGGFPCQDVSTLGTRTGLDGARSGLWWEYARIIDETKPAAVVIENVEALITRGLDRVLSTLTELGYMGRWDMVSAVSVGANHRRRRIFITATHPERVQLRQQQGWGGGESGPRAIFTDVDGDTRDASHPDVPHIDRVRLSGRGSPPPSDADMAGNWWASRPAPSPIRGVDDGVPGRVDGSRRRRRPPNDKLRLHALGNAVVPQCAELVGRQLIQMLKGPP